MAPQFSVRERTFIAVKYHQTHSPEEVQRLFAVQFPNANRIPSKPAIYNIVDKLSNHGTVRNRNREGSGRPRSGRSQRNINRVRRELQRNPNISSRNNPLPDLPQSTFNRITRLDLHWHLCNDELTNGDIILSLFPIKCMKRISEQDYCVLINSVLYPMPIIIMHH